MKAAIDTHAGHMPENLYVFQTFVPENRQIHFFQFSGSCFHLINAAVYSKCIKILVALLPPVC